MSDPEYGSYIDDLLGVAMVKKYNIDDFDVDVDSYEEVRSAVEEIGETGLMG